MQCAVRVGTLILSIFLCFWYVYVCFNLEALILVDLCISFYQVGL